MTEIKRRKIIERAGRTAQTIRERYRIAEKRLDGGKLLAKTDPLLKDAENAIMALLGVLKETEKQLRSGFGGAVELYRLDDPIRHEIRFRVEELVPLGREQAELLVFEKIMSAVEGEEK